MALSVYDKGDVVRISGVFKNAAGAAVDPSTVTLKVKRPAGGTEIDYAYPADAELIKSATGNYYADIDADTVGDWQFRWESTGTGAGAEEGAFIVKHTDFA